MKKFIICAMLFATMLCGCAAQSSDKSGGCYTENFVLVKGGLDTHGYIYVDKNTRVMYWHTGGDGGITVILNADGTPMLWEGELE